MFQCGFKAIGFHHLPPGPGAPVLAPSAEHRGRWLKAVSLPRCSSSRFLLCRKCDTNLPIITMWPIQQSHVPHFWAGIFWDHTSFKEAAFLFNNKVTALTEVHLAQFCIAPCARVHFCKAKRNYIKFILAAAPCPAPGTKLAYNIETSKRWIFWRVLYLPLILNITCPSLSRKFVLWMSTLKRPLTHDVTAWCTDKGIVPDFPQWELYGLDLQRRLPE